MSNDWPPGKLVRYVQRLPHGGRRHTLGRDGSKGRPLGCVTWSVDEPKARWVRQLFTLVDTTDTSDLSYRGLGAHCWRRRLLPMRRCC